MKRPPINPALPQIAALLAEWRRALKAGAKMPKRKQP